MLPLLVTAAVLAHSPPPQPFDVHERPGMPNQLLVGTNFGGLLSTNGGATWQLVCEDAIGYPQGFTPNWWLSPSGATFAASPKGLFVSRDGMCSWAQHPQFEDGGASDIQGLDGSVVVTTGSYLSSGVLNNIYYSSDDGLTFTPSDALDDAGFYSSVRIAPSRPQRVYAADWWFDPYTEKLAVSDDGAKTFNVIDHTTDFPAGGSFYVLAVSPQNPDVLLASLRTGTSPSDGYLLLSENAGTTFSVVVTSLMSDALFKQAAFSPDGQKAWVALDDLGGGNHDQLLQSIDGAHTFTPLSPPQSVPCVAAYDDRLYTCSKQNLDGWAVGKGATSATPGFGPQLIWQQIEGPLSCPGNTHVNDICQVYWPVTQAQFPAPPAGFDGGTGGGAGGGAGGGGAGGGGNGNHCGCAAGPPGLLFFGLLLVLGMSRRREPS